MNYEAPTLTVHGSLRDITLALGDGAYLDADYPESTKKEDLTFSG